MAFMTGEERLRTVDGAEDWSFGDGAAHEQEGERERGGWRVEGRGESGHKDMVCSRCCVERGADGEVRCLGCLRGEEGMREAYR